MVINTIDETATASIPNSSGVNKRLITIEDTKKTKNDTKLSIKVKVKFRLRLIVSIFIFILLYLKGEIGSEAKK